MKRFRLMQGNFFLILSLANKPIIRKECNLWKPIIREIGKGY